MRSGIALIIIIAALGLLAVLGVSGYAVAKNFTKTESPRKFDFLQNPKSILKSSSSPFVITPSSNPQGQQNIPLANASPVSTVFPSLSPITYKQPQGKYVLTIPGDWQVNSITSGATYTTTKFTGTSGNVSITIGSGKDPLGGCSETSNVVLTDRTISGCFLLQKDGSQILTRAYTKDKAGLDITVEAYINPQLSINKPIVLSTIKTIQIN